MSVFGGIMLFAAGVATGGGLILYNQFSVANQTSQLRRENEHLKQSAWKDRLEYESDRAYRKGYNEGRKSPLSDVERLAETLESRHIDFRTVPQDDNRRNRRASREGT